MKGQISRISHDRANRYSAVYQVQGGMVTDADLGEASELAKVRVDELGNDAIGDGVPVAGGAVVPEGAGVRLRPGIIYADGVRGRLEVSGNPDLTPPLALYDNQKDLPRPPPRNAGHPLVFYADIWECPVFPLTEAHLVDPGLHGVETSFRTRTMTQVKVAPAAQRDNISNAAGPFPRRGNAVLTAAISAANAVVDPCDPCATDIGASVARLSNALYRLEVQDVQGPANAPTRVTLMWSIENAAERFRTDPKPPSSFTDRPGSVFEFFSATTEAHKGVFADPATRRSSHLESVYPTPVPNRTDGDAGIWPFVRRWDGFATISLAPLQVAGNPPAVSIDAGKVKIALPAITLTLDVAGKALVTGDHWLVEIRQFAEASDRVRVESATPSGIEHHYTVLFSTAADGSVATLSDADRRRLTFPTLANFPADHISFQNNCPKLYGVPNAGGAENVQQALDRLCDINAADIPFDNHCHNVFDAAGTVQEALDALCRADFSPRLGYRLLFDWGVVCGVRVHYLGEGRVEITPGAILDRTGRLMVLPWDTPKTFDLDPMITDVLAGPTSTDICLALLITETLDVKVDLIQRKDWLAPEDRTFAEVVSDCDQRYAGIEKMLDQTLVQNRTSVKDRFVLAATGPTALASTLRLTQQDEVEINQAMNAIVTEMKPLLAATESASLDAAFAAADTQHNPDTAAGDAALFIRGQKAIAKFNAVTDARAALYEQCRCDALLPDCPGKDVPPFVPIACVTIDKGRRRVTAICQQCRQCRKQALTPRSLRYWWLADQYASLTSEYERICCPKPDTPVRPDRPKGPVLTRPPIFELPVPFPQPFGPFPPGPDPEGPIKWNPRPDVVNMNEATATEVLRGHGVDVSPEPIDLDDANALTALADRGATVNGLQRISSGGAIAPGDQVVLLKQGGVVRDYAVLQKGEGRYLFPTGTEKVTPTVDMSLVDSKLADANVARDALSRQITELNADRERLATQVVGLRSDIERLQATEATVATNLTEISTQRATLAQEVATLVTQRDQLNTDLQRMSTSLTQQRAQLTQLQADQQKALQDLRASQPVSVVIGNNPRLQQELAQQNVTTVGDLNRLLQQPQGAQVFDRAAVSQADRQQIINAVRTRMTGPGG